MSLVNQIEVKEPQILKEMSTVKLSDLTAEEKKALLAEAAAEEKANKAKKKKNENNENNEKNEKNEKK